MLAYLVSILSVFGDVATIGMNTIVVTIDRPILTNISNRIFALGGKRVGRNSATQFYKCCGVDIRINFN